MVWGMILSRSCLVRLVFVHETGAPLAQDVTLYNLPAVPNHVHNARSILIGHDNVLWVLPHVVNADTVAASRPILKVYTDLCHIARKQNYLFLFLTV